MTICCARISTALFWRQRKPQFKAISLRMSQVANQAEANSSFRSMKRLGVFLLLPGWDVSPSQGILGDLGAASREDAIFSGKSLLQERESRISGKARSPSACAKREAKQISGLIIKITISSIVIGLKNSYFPLIHLPSCRRTACYRTVCYRTVQ